MKRTKLLSIVVVCVLGAGGVWAAKPHQKFSSVIVRVNPGCTEITCYTTGTAGTCNGGGTIYADADVLCTTPITNTYSSMP
jgi:hypothetical protein